MSIRIGAAPGSWGIRFPEHPGQVPWWQFLDEVAEAGYRWIEPGPYGYLPTDPPTLMAELERRDLKVTATTVMLGHLEEPAAWEDLREEVLRAGELGASVGSRFMILIDDFYTDLFEGSPRPAPTLDGNGWEQAIEATFKVSEIAREQFGLRLLYHPHSGTHIETEEQIVTFLEKTDPGWVSLCLDTGHHAYAGGDPINFIREHHSRVAYLHLKTLEPRRYRKARAENLSIQQATQSGVFCEPADGTLDFRELGELLHQVEFDGWAMVEQDMWQPPPEAPLPIAKRTLRYMREIGMGDGE